MRERLDYLSKVPEERDKKIRDLNVELDITRSTVKEERAKRDSVFRQMRDITLKNETLKAKLLDERREDELRRAKSARLEGEDTTPVEAMEVGMAPASPPTENTGTFRPQQQQLLQRGL